MVKMIKQTICQTCNGPKKGLNKNICNSCYRKTRVEQNKIAASKWYQTNKEEQKIKNRKYNQEHRPKYTRTRIKDTRGVITDKEEVTRMGYEKFYVGIKDNKKDWYNIIILKDITKDTIEYYKMVRHPKIATIECKTYNINRDIFRNIYRQITVEEYQCMLPHFKCETNDIFKHIILE